MASSVREDNELIRARGGQLHTIRTLIKSSEVAAQPRTKKLVGEEDAAPSSPSEVPVFEVPSSMRPPLTPPSLLALLSPGFSPSQTELNLDLVFTTY